MQKMKNQRCRGKVLKLNCGFFDREKIEKCKWWKKGRKIKYEITTGLIFRREPHILGP
jgi:hypothetical protein